MMFNIMRIGLVLAGLLVISNTACVENGVSGRQDGGRDAGSDAGRDAGSLEDAGASDGGFVFPPRPDAAVDHPLDDTLRLNQIQMKGTHNSFHMRTIPLLSTEWDYEHQPIDVQLESQGVRAIELDVFWNWSAGRYDVYHVYLVDDATTCRRLADCLATLRVWSDAHPAHHPIFVQIEGKGAVGDDVSHANALEEAILDVIPRSQIITPDDVRGDAETLREAVTTTGWPTLGETRGKILFFLDCARELCVAYAHDGESLDGRLLFAASQSGDPFAGVMVINTPGQAVTDAVEAGFIVRTRAFDVGDAQEDDDSSIAPALASGGHIISTDVPAPVPEYGLHLEIPGGTPSRCNPITAPEQCTSTDVEDPEILAGGSS
jgi:hypothetical protein